MKRNMRLISALVLALIAFNTGIAQASVQTISWSYAPLPSANALGFESTVFDTATSSAGAPITYRIIDSSGSNCSIDNTGMFVTYENGNCMIQATAAAIGSYTPVSTTRIFTLTTSHPGGPHLEAQTISNVPANQTMIAGASLLLPDATASYGIDSATPTVMESASSACYLIDHTLYAPNPGICYVTYVESLNSDSYITASDPQVITVLPAPVVANIDVPLPPPAPVLDKPGVPVVASVTEPVKIVVPSENGATISVTAPAGVLPDQSSLTVTPVTAPEAVKSGLVQVEVKAFNSNGDRITQLNKVLTINLGHLALEGNAVAYSQDGLVWQTITKIDGTVLPDDLNEGYYLDGDGAVVILTRHLTFYGTKRLAKDLILLAPNRSHEIGTSVSLKLQGGSGTGALTYISLTPKICSITQQGVVTALAAGDCSVDAVKNGDSVYSSSTSGPLLLNIKAKGVRVFTVGKKVTVQTFLSNLYANTSVDLYMLDFAVKGSAASKGSNSTGFVQKVESSGRGSLRFTFLPNKLPKAFAIEVRSGDALLAATNASSP